MKQVHDLIAKYWDKVREHRIWLHEHPELSGREKNSAAYIAGILREMGLTPTEGVGGYGVTAVIEGKGPGKCAGLRADFDALPVQECTGLPYPSKNEGVAHVCGHDAHAAMLLGAAYVLRELRDRFNGRVKLVFQPSEEVASASGAKAMIADGVLENPHVDAMFGQHVWPQIELGKAGVRNGAMMAASDRFFITVKGKGSHGSRPEDGVDAIVLAAHVVTALQTIVSRSVGALDSAVVSIGNIHGGGAYNVIADEVKLEGTCRTLNPSVRDAMPERMERIIRGVTEGLGGGYEFRYVRCYSPTINDPEMFELMKGAIAETVGPENLLLPESSALGGEDFSFYCEKVPSCFFWLGCRGGDQPYYPIHSGHFYANEAALPIGMEVLVTAALRFLGE